MLLNLSYGYDLRDSVTSIGNGSFTETYGYDLRARNQTTGPWGTVSYGYDPVGNRLSKSVQGGSTISYAYDNMDRLVSATGLGFAWDDNGNMVYKNDGTYAWNYTYDTLNRRNKVRARDLRTWFST
jgi:YD repeat-containing protein